MNRPVLFFILAAYMVLVGALLSAIGVSYDKDTNTIEGNMTMVNERIKGSTIPLITGLSLIPTWLEVILIILPSVLLLLIIISWFIPGISPGG